MTQVFIHHSVSLSAYIKAYWTIDAVTGEHRELVYPTGDTQLLFHYGEPFRTVLPDGASYRQPRCSASGPATSYRRVIARPGCGVIGVVLHPHAARAFIPCPLHELTDDAVPAEDLWRGVPALASRLRDGVSSFERIMAVEAFLAERLRAVDTHQLGSLIAAMSAVEGPCPLRHLVETTGLAERRIERLFRSGTGLSPKQYLDILRFNRAIPLLASASRLTDVALDAGYYDQSHFIRAVKRYTGLTPGELRRATAGHGGGMSDLYN